VTPGIAPAAVRPTSVPAWLFAGAIASSACAPAPVPLAPPTSASWRAGVERLATLRRSALADHARTFRVTLALREPFTGKTLRARGAVAVSPPDALRMILVGPGGTTALDLWTRGDRFRFAVPAIGLVKRGDERTARGSMRGMPVDFLRWWFLRPADGTLLWHARDAGGDRFVLRDGAAVVDLFARDDGHLTATRTTWERDASGDLRRLEEEQVEASGVRCSSVSYRQRSTGLRVEVTCEGEEHAAAPSPRAFEDPDGAGSAP
jgi:hypothetical protein